MPWSAPLAAWVIRFLPARGLGVAVAGLLFVTNVRELTSSAGLGVVRWLAYGLVVLACGYAAVRSRLGPQLSLTSPEARWRATAIRLHPQLAPGASWR